MGEEEDKSSGFVLSKSESGLSSEHPPHMQLHTLVAPTPEESDATFNAIRAALVPVACWRLDDPGFMFDSSLIVPAAKSDVLEIVSLRGNYPKCPASIFAHADPVGDDEYNKKLSGRRAQSLYGLFRRDHAIWEDLYSHPLGGDNWGLASVQHMLLALDGSLPEDQAGRYHPGKTDGKKTKESDAALKHFKEDHELPPNATNDAATRKVLFLAYMDWLFDNTKEEPVFVAEDFLGKGAKDGKGDYQGCGEFNPILLFSKEDDKELSKPINKEKRNVKNGPNRRVVVFFYRPGSHLVEGAWPCPTAKEGTAGCRKRFWSDHKKRLELRDEERKYEDKRDTFACRFYDRMARRSPCEAGYREWVIRLVEPGSGKLDERPPLADQPWKVVGSFAKGSTDANGVMRIRAHASVDEIKVKVAGTVLTFKAGELPEMSSAPPPVRLRLYSLGYGKNSTDPLKWSDKQAKAALRAFKKANDLADDDVLDDATVAKIKDLYGS